MKGKTLKFWVKLGIAVCLVLTVCRAWALETVTVDNVADLLSELIRLNGDAHTIKIEEGDYNLPDTAMHTDNNFGLSTLLVNKVKLVGLGSSPSDVKLVGAGSKRIVFLNNSGVLQNLMITNGNATVKYNNGSNSDRGGGVYCGSNTVMTNCIVAGCAARLGGGVYCPPASSAILRNCYVHDNYSISDGGGLYNVTAHGCRIADNISGGGGHKHNTNEATLIDCDVSGTTVAGGSALNTVFHNIGGTKSINIPFANFTATVKYIYMNYPCATNCLFRDNATPTDSALFRGVDSATKSSSLVNCTIVSNKVQYTFRAFSTAACPMTVKNCVFADNFHDNGTTASDIRAVVSGVTANALRFSHIAYGVTDIGNWADYADDTSTIHRFGENGFKTSPSFAGADNPEHPYSISRHSPLRDIGEVMSWMSSATDIRGDGFPRLRGGKVDLGCYQCWDEIPGFCVFVR